MDRLPKREANYTPLSPITFLPRAAAVYGRRTSLIYNNTRFTWADTHNRCLRLASALTDLNVSKNDVVSVLAPNVPALYELHFAVPMAGAVLNTINTRLDARGIATILAHSDAKIFFVDYEYVSLAGVAINIMVADGHRSLPLVAVIDDVDTPTGTRLGELEYEEMVSRGDPGYLPRQLSDEWDPITLNYTSGTTAAPKGVVYSHRGAYLSTVSLLLQWEVASEPVYLWSLPMFHCNGWTFTWGMAARGGTNVCIRTSSAAVMHRAIAEHKVTHMCAAPTVLTILLERGEHHRLGAPVHILTGGAPPPPTILQQVEKMGFNVTHAYGLTEATGPAMVCEWRAQWDRLPSGTRAALKSRQGVPVLSLADADVKILGTLESVPRDGVTTGEIVLKGSSIMKGYYKNEKETAEAMKDGWFWTGDQGVVHPDGYVEIKDRLKDVIISGGENISSKDVETALYTHPSVAEAAVVAMPHTHWGETPCAFIVLKKGYSEVREEEIIAHCRGAMAKFMVPKRVVFVPEIPKNPTGKALKTELREAARRLMPVHEKPKSKPQQAEKVPYYNGNNGLPEGHHQQVFALSRL